LEITEQANTFEIHADVINIGQIANAQINAETINMQQINNGFLKGALVGMFSTAGVLVASYFLKHYIGSNK
jgi:hypothetical protein